MKSAWTILRSGHAKWWLGFWAALVMLDLLPVVSNFLSNRFEVSVQDLIAPVILVMVTAAVVAAAFSPFVRRRKLAGVSGAVFLVMATSSFYDNKLSGVWPLMQAVVPVPGGAEGPVFSLVLLAAIGTAGYWLGRGLEWLAARLKWNQRTVIGAGLVAITVTFVLQALPLVRDLAVEWPQFFYKPPALASLPAAAKTGAKPDIYYIVMDRYASPDVLKSQFNYSDDDFLNYLKDQGYYVRDNAHNNYPYTTMSIASTMDANYLNDVVKRFGGSTQQTVVPFNESIRKSAVAGALKNIGYTYDEIGNWYETSNVSSQADNFYQPEGRLTVLGQQSILNNFSKNILTQSPLWRFLQGGISIGGFKIFGYSNLGDVDMDHAALSSLSKLASTNTGGRFVFAHILLPHDPYYFNADGSLSTNTEADNVGESVKEKYLNQLQYVNGQMKSILTQINKSSDGKAVVVLQSDEGPYPFQINDQNFDTSNVDEEMATGDMRAWPDQDLQMKYGNLAAYHLPGVDLGSGSGEGDGATSANIFRLVLNSYFGAQMPYLPNCYYAYANGRSKPELFVDITKRLSGSPSDSRCQADGTVRE